MFLTRKTVTYSWTVVPVEIEDTYKIVLEPVFETNVPVPVVTIDTPFIMPLVVEDRWTQVELSLTNHGLIAAQGLTIQLPTSPYYELEVLTSDIGVIPAKTTVQVPVRIRGKTSALLNQQAVATIEQALRGRHRAGRCHPGAVPGDRFGYPLRAEPQGQCLVLLRLRGERLEEGGRGPHADLHGQGPV